VVALACVRALCCVGVRVVVASAFHGSHRAGALVHVTALGASSGTAGSFGERSRARIYIVAPPTVYAGAGVCIVRRVIGGPPIAWMGCDDGAERKAEREAYRGGVIRYRGDAIGHGRGIEHRAYPRVVVVTRAVDDHATGRDDRAVVAGQVADV